MIHIATLDPPDAPVFPLPKRGYAMIKTDLKNAGIPYVLDGRTFDFHAVRGMTATIHDEIGTPSGVRRELMRHATDSMTALYTRPREDQGRQAVVRLASALASAGTATKSATSAKHEHAENDASVDADAASDDDMHGVYAGAIPAASTNSHLRFVVSRVLVDNHSFGEREGSRMADRGPILVTEAAGELGAVGRTVTGQFLKRGLPGRATVREDDRGAALRTAGADVVVRDLLVPADV
jgi:hypothetical protein